MAECTTAAAERVRPTPASRAGGVKRARPEEEDSTTCESPTHKRQHRGSHAFPDAVTRAPLATWVAQRDRALPPAPTVAPDPPDTPRLQQRVRVAHREHWRITTSWMCEVAIELNTRTETTFRALALLQRVYGRTPCRLDTLQLQAVTVMHVAAKQEEIFPPLLGDYVYMTDRAYTGTQIIATERALLTWLEHRLLPATPHEWLSAWDVPTGPLRTRATHWILFRLVHHWDTHQRDRAEPLAAAGLAAAARTLGGPCPASAAHALQSHPTFKPWPPEEYAASVKPWLTRVGWRNK